MEACQRLGRTLRIAGDGPEGARLKRAAQPTSTFLGELSNEQLWSEYASCRALLFAADEDFGMVPLEAQARGRPVICYGAGGSLETVRGSGDAPTGVYFAEQTVESAMQGILDFEAREQQFDPQVTQAWARQFATPRFLAEFRAFVLQHVPAAAAAMESA
jgi:glycosyltransferase involved in cell wall biosynthesis